MTEPKTTLTDGTPVTPDHREIDPATGQQKAYVVLSAEERAKGFVRPVRRSYVHGLDKSHSRNLRDLTDAEHKRYNVYELEQTVIPDPWVKALDLPGGTTDYFRDRDLKGCGAVTTMGQALAETYARQPDFYTGTFCVGCRAHFPVGPDGEFYWDGTTRKVGT